MPDYSDTKVKDMVFNILDSATYNTLLNNGQLNSNQLYFITNDGETFITTTTESASTNLAHGGKYKLTAGGYSTVFTLPAGYSHPTTTATSAAAVKVGKDNQGHVVLGSALTASDVGASPSNHTHSISLATDTGTSAVTLSHGGKYKLTAGGQSIIFTMPSSVTDTNYYHKTGSWNGLKYTAGKVGSPDDLEFTIPTGTTSTTVALGNHTHTLSLATDTGTSQLTLSHGGKYKLTAGGNSYIFTMPSASTDTNYYHKTGSWSGLTYTAGKVGSPDDLAFTIPTGTTATTVSPGNHTHTLSLATDTGTSSITLSHGGKYKLTAGGSTYIFTMPSASTDTNYYHKTGSWSGLTYTAEKVGSPDDLAFTIPTGTTASTVAVGNHTHSLSIAASTGTNQLTLSHGGKYQLTAGGSTYIFTMPSVSTIPTITLNGSATTTPSFYAPTSAGTSEYILKSNGSGAPTWLQTLPVANGGTGATSFTANSIIMSGSSTTAALTTRSITDSTSNSAVGTSTSIPTERDIYYGLVTVNGSSQSRATGIYAPTSAGTSGYVLKSNGSGAPSWASATLTDENVKQTNTTSSGTYRVLFSYNENDTTETTGTRKNTNFTYNPTSGVGLIVNNDFALGSTSNSKGRIYSDASGTLSGSETTITADNVATYFEQQAIDATYPWTYDTTNAYWYVAGTTQDVHNLNNIVTIQWKALSKFALKIHYQIHSEGNYDFLRVWVNDIQKFEKSGNNITGDSIVFLKSNDIVKIIFRKDGSGNPTGEYYRAVLGRQSYSDLNVITVKQPFRPELDNTYSLGTTDLKWSALYIGTDNSYGSSSQPIYWDNGKPKACTNLSVAITLNGSSTTSASFYAPTSSGTANQILVSGGANTAPTWKATANGAAYATSSNGALTFGTLPVAQGGTGTTSFTANSVVISGSSTTSALTTRSITDSSSASAISTNTSIPTERDIYYGLPTINNSHSYTSSTTIYAPTGGGTANQILVSAGSTSAPTWQATANGAAYATSANGALTFGTLPVAQGGTGATTFTSGALLIGNGTSAVGTRSITNNTSNTAISTGTNIPTMNTIYYGLVTVNGSSQTRATGIYAPTSAGTSGQYLQSNGSGAPSWVTLNVSDEKVKLTSNTGSTAVPLVLGPTSITSGTSYNCLYNTNLKYTPSTGNLQTTQINGVTVGSSPKFTDTVTTVSSSGSGNVVTGMSASNGAITYTMGTVNIVAAQIIRW